MNQDGELWCESACNTSRVRDQKWTEKPESKRDASRRVSDTCERVSWVHRKRECPLWLVGAERGSYVRFKRGTAVERLQRGASGEL